MERLNRFRGFCFSSFCDNIRTYLVTLFLLLFGVSVQAQKTVTGYVTDSISGEPVSYASVYVKSTGTGTRSDDDGRFVLKRPSVSTEIVISAIGYVEKTVKLTSGSSTTLQIQMRPADYQLKEVVVRPKKERYKRKGNPAVDFVKNVMAANEKNDPRQHDYYSYERYEKVTFALNDFKNNKIAGKKYDFLSAYIDSSDISRKPVLNISEREKLETIYYRKSPHTEKTIILGKKHSGMDEVISPQGMEAMMNETFKDVDLFKNNISLFTNKFVSPLSSIGPSFYKYYLADTVVLEGDSCAILSFAPANSESFGFVGQMWVTLDSTWFVKRARLLLSTNINLNFVEDMEIDQSYTRAPDGTRLVQRDFLTTDFKLKSNSKSGIHARRLVTFKDQSFDPPEDMSIFSIPEKEKLADGAESRKEDFWKERRHEPLQGKENLVARMMTQLRSYPAFYYTEKVIGALVAGYIPTRKEKNLIDLGPMNTTISGNSLEGARFRVGGMTTANLNPHWFGKAYLAYGTKDKKLKYLAEVEYSFLRKKEHQNEFPIHSLKASYNYDIDQLGQHYLYTNKDNVFLSVKRKRDSRVTYLRDARLEYTREFYSGFSYKAILRYRTQYATPNFVPFLKMSEIEGEYTPVKDYSMGELEVRLRYAPNEKYYQSKSYRYPVSLDMPVFTLSHIVAHKGVMGSDYSYNCTEFGFQKRFWFSAFGHTDVILRAGKVWDKVPFPLLLIPNANLSYTIQPESFTQMNAMEFLNDQYVSWDVTYYANGWIFNRIPFLKKLQWREVGTFRGWYGDLSKKNIPTAENGLFVFPEGSYVMGKMPYMEAGVGIENIFKFLRLDYVWRLTYRDHPHINKHGVRFSMRFTF